MEQSMVIMAKKLWKMIRIAYFMLRKGVSKAKLLADLNAMKKRGKIAGKAAVQSLMFPHRSSAAEDDSPISFPVPPPDEYEFSCSNSPAYPNFRLPFHLSRRKHLRAAQSPDLPGFGPSPMVRQLRVTDSPFPLRNVDGDDHVDEKAEEFINKFYKELKKQNATACLEYY